MERNKINKKFVTVFFLFILVLVSLIIIDFNLHNPYGLTTDSLYHLSIINHIDKTKNIPVVEPQTGIDKPEYPTGFHTWLITISNLTGMDKNFVTFNSNLLMTLILIFSMFVFIRRISNEKIAILILIILIFSGGIGWILYPKILSVNFKDVFDAYMMNTGLFEGNLFSTKLLSSSTQTIAFILMFLFFYLLHNKRYFLSSLTLIIISYTHRTSIIFILIFLVFYLFAMEEKNKRIVIIPIMGLLGSLFWNYYYPTIFFLSNKFIMFFLRIDNVLRVFLLGSIIAFFIPNKAWNKKFFKLGFIAFLIIFILDVFFHFNNLTGEFYTPVYKQIIFVFGPLLISFFFIDQVDNDKNKLIYIFLFTVLFISQTNALTTVMGPERILIFMMIPLAFIYSKLIVESKENKFKIILSLLLLLLLVGNFVDLNRYTRNSAFGGKIPLYSESLNFIKTNLPEDVRIITSTGFCASSSRNSIIIPAMTDRNIYCTYVFSYNDFLTKELKFADVPPFNQSIIKGIIDDKNFMYKTDVLSRRLQVAYLFENPDMNITGTKLKELNTHILTTKKECDVFTKYYELIYSDTKVCMFKI